MQQKIKTITIYASASSRIDLIYFEAAAKLGKLLADHSITCVNGGGIKGLMSAISDAVWKTEETFVELFPNLCMIKVGYIQQFKK